MKNEIVNTYPWPPKELSPNARIHWRKRNPIKRRYREQCYALTNRDAALLLHDGNIRGRFVFQPPDKKVRDFDNCLAMCKPLIDGMCARLDIDDRYIRPVELDFGDVVKFGQVIVRLELSAV